MPLRSFGPPESVRLFLSLQFIMKYINAIIAAYTLVWIFFTITTFWEGDDSFPLFACFGFAGFLLLGALKL